MFIYTIKIKYIVLKYAAKEVTSIIYKLKLDRISKTELFRDNEMSIILTKNAESEH